MPQRLCTRTHRLLRCKPVRWTVATHLLQDAVRLAPHRDAQRLVMRLGLRARTGAGAGARKWVASGARPGVSKARPATQAAEQLAYRFAHTQHGGGTQRAAHAGPGAPPRGRRALPPPPSAVCTPPTHPPTWRFQAGPEAVWKRKGSQNRG